jgi:MOSC domain-containing protein YiiM
VTAAGQTVATGIFKKPVAGPVQVGRLNLAGDGQADLSLHGGPDKAVYAYSWKNTEFWRETLQRDDLRPGSFGENLTMDDLPDTEIAIGDELEIGSARFLVTQPRLPCFKLGIALGRPDFPKLFHHSGRNGFYLRVLKEGVVAADDPIRRIRSDDSERITIAEFTQVYMSRSVSRDEWRRLTALRGLPDSWKDWIRKKAKVRTA